MGRSREIECVKRKKEPEEKMMRVVAVETRRVVTGERDVRSESCEKKNFRGKNGIWNASFCFICIVFSIFIFFIF